MSIILESKIGVVLFGKGHHPALLRANSMLAVPLEPTETVGQRFRKILEDSTIRPYIDDYEVFPLIIEAAIVAYPLQADSMLTKFEAYVREEARTLEFPFPTVLGFLNGLKHGDMDEVWIGKEYAPRLCQLFEKVVFGKTTFHTAPAESDDPVSDIKIQKGLLSEAVTLFVRGNSKREGEIGARRAHIFNFLGRIDKALYEGKKLSEFGEVLIDELCYKLFGSLSTQGRVRAFSLLHNDFVSNIKS